MQGIKDATARVVSSSMFHIPHLFGSFLTQIRMRLGSMQGRKHTFAGINCRAANDVWPLCQAFAEHGAVLSSVGKTCKDVF